MGGTQKLMCVKGIDLEQLPASKGIRALMKGMKLCALLSPEKPGSH
jgi:hypothetical protein